MVASKALSGAELAGNEFRQAIGQLIASTSLTVGLFTSGSSYVCDDV